MALTQRQHLFIGQSCAWVTLASQLAVFRYLVGMIHGVSAEKQMVDADAWWVITVMEDEQPVWDYTEMELPRVAVREHPPITKCSTRVMHAIAIGVATFGIPFPAPISLRDARPETFVFGQVAHAESNTLSGAETAPDVRRAAIKPRPALRAVQLNASTDVRCHG